MSGDAQKVVNTFEVALAVRRGPLPGRVGNRCRVSSVGLIVFVGRLPVTALVHE